MLGRLFTVFILFSATIIAQQPVASCKAKGMGGACVARGLDSLTTFYNPATATQVACRSDFGFHTRFTSQSLQLSNRPPLPLGTQQGNIANQPFWDLYGEAGVTGRYGCFAAALQLNNYSHLHTHYNSQLTDFSGFTATEALGTEARLNLRTEVLSTTLAFQANHFSFGIAANLYFSLANVQGLEKIATGEFSTDPASVTNRGDDYAVGVGLTAGCTACLAKNIVGFSYSPRVHMGEHKKYRGLFASSLDIPETFRAGVSTKVCGTAWALDGEYRRYSSIRGWQNRFPSSEPFALFGSAQGAGFSWGDQWIFRAGLEQSFNCKFTARLGYRFEKSPLKWNRESDTALNALSLSVVEHHATIGCSFRPDALTELSLYLDYGFFRQLQGEYPFIRDQWVFGKLKYNSFHANLGISLGRTF